MESKRTVWRGPRLWVMLAAVMIGCGLSAGAVAAQDSGGTPVSLPDTGQTGSVASPAASESGVSALPDTGQTGSVASPADGGDSVSGLPSTGSGSIGTTTSVVATALVLVTSVLGLGALLTRRTIGRHSA